MLCSSRPCRSFVRLIQITVNTLSTTAQMTIRVSATSCSSSTLSDIRCAGLLVGSNTHKSAVTPYPDILRVHHPPVPRACELPSRQRHQRSPRPPRRPPRMRCLLRPIRQHFPNSQLRRGATLVKLPTVPPNAIPALAQRTIESLCARSSSGPVSRPRVSFSL